MKKIIQIALSLFIFTTITTASEIPTFKPLSANLSHTTIQAGNTIYLYLQLSLPKGWHTYGQNPGTVGKPFSITWNNNPYLAPQKIQWQPPKTFETGSIKSQGYESDVTFKIPVKINTNTPSGIYNLKGQAFYLVCNDICIPKKELITTSINVSNTSIPSRDYPNLENDFHKNKSTTHPSFLASLKLLLGAFLGGLILNVMPCVFPILSLKAFSLISTSPTPSERIKEGWSYTAGIIIAMTGLGSIALLLRHLGSEIGWGFHLQSPIVVTLLIWLMMLLSLYFSGLLPQPEWLATSASNIATKGHKWKHASPKFHHLITGMLAVFVAAPCTAPFMASTLGVALLQPGILSIEIFIALGLGLASPYLILCYSPSAQKFLPKPGAWMKTIEKILAIPMALTALWLLSVLYKQTAIPGILFAGIGLLSILGLLRLKRFFTEETVQSKRIITLLVIAGIFALLLKINTLKTTSKPLHLPTYAKPYSAAYLNELKSKHQPILLDVTAAWCITCEVNRKTVIEDPEIQALLKKNNVTVLVADWTDYNAEITELLHTYNRSGVPLVVWIDKAGKESIMPQILSKKILKNNMETLNEHL